MAAECTAAGGKELLLELLRQYKAAGGETAELKAVLSPGLWACQCSDPGNLWIEGLRLTQNHLFLRVLLFSL